jgi:DNA topoisomerase VI B subunit
LAKSNKKSTTKKSSASKKGDQDNKGKNSDGPEVPDLEGVKQKGVIKQGTIAEFMRKRTQLVGFDIGYHKHTQYMAEFTDNALDAIEVGNWKYPKMYKLKDDFYLEYPKIEPLKDEDINAKNIILRMTELLDPVKDVINTEPMLIIRLQEIDKPEMLSDEQTTDTRMFSFECFDNGIGLVPSDLEKFGKYLASSKSEQLKQTRGSQGFGASSAFSDAQNTTGRPVTVISRHIENKKATLTTFFTTSKNEKDYTIEPSEIRVPFQHGTYVRLNYLNVRYIRGYADDYIRQTGLLNSHMTLIFIDPYGDVMVYPRRVMKFPNEPKYAKPHPASSSIGDFKEMLRTTRETSIITFLEQKFVRMSRDRAKKIVENANKELGGAKGLYSKAPPDLNEKEIRALTRELNRQKSCLSRLSPSDFKDFITQAEQTKPLLNTLADSFPEIPKKWYKKILKQLNLTKKTLADLSPEDADLILQTTRDLVQCPTLVSFKAFKDLCNASADRTVYDILNDDFCKLNYNTIRKVIFDADESLNYKTLNSKTVKDLGKRETDVLFGIVSDTVETDQVNTKTDFQNLLKSGKNRNVSSVLQDLKGLGKSTASEIIDKADEKLKYKSLLTMNASELTNKELKAVYDKLMEVDKCPAAITSNMLEKLLKDSPATGLSTFLHRNFLDINTKIAEEIVDSTNEQLGGHISLENVPPNELDEDQMNALYKTFTSEKYLAPPTDTVVPVGSDILERVIKKHFEPQFIAAETRSPTSGKGLAFVVEVALAYGGKIRDVSKAADVIYRFVNRTPKLRDNSDCAIWKTTSKVNWKNYKVDTFDNGIPKGKTRVFVNVSGPFVHVMFKSQSKQALADDETLMKEIQLALEAAGRKLKSFLLGKEKSKRKARRAMTLLKNVKTFAQSLYNVECKDFNTGKHIEGKPPLEDIELQLSTPIKEDLKPDIKSVLTEQWSTLPQVIEDLGLETLRDKFIKDLITEVLSDLSAEYNIIEGATPKEITEKFQKQSDPYTEKLILETLRIRDKEFMKCDDCELGKEKSMCSYYNPESVECRIEQETFKSFTNELKENYDLDPLNDEILLDYLGMLEVQIERGMRLNKVPKNLEAQKEKFIGDLKATSPKSSGISRVKHGAALAFSDAWKNVKEKIFWRVIQPNLKSNIAEDDLTLDGILEMKFTNIKGGTLTQKDEFVKEILQNVIDDLIDDGIIMQTKKKDVYRPIKKK